MIKYVLFAHFIVNTVISLIFFVDATFNEFSEVLRGEHIFCYWIQANFHLGTHWCKYSCTRIYTLVYILYFSFFLSFLFLVLSSIISSWFRVDISDTFPWEHHFLFVCVWDRYLTFVYHTLYSMAHINCWTSWGWEMSMSHLPL